MTLLADGPLELTVATPWGAIAAAGPWDDDVIELSRMQRPGERERLTVRDAIAGHGPAWTGTGLRSARGGARLLISCELPEGAGVSASAATEAAIRHCLTGHGADGLPDSPATACALLGARPLPFDLAATGLRLVIIDTRIRDAERPAPAEASSLAAAVKALAAGDLTAIGALLTAAHEALDCVDAQHGAVTAALGAGALGARAIADGPGRPACALVPASRLADVRAAVRAWFSGNELRPPRLLTFTPAPESRQAWHGDARPAAGPRRPPGQ